jgi:hypothetical protein
MKGVPVLKKIFYSSFFLAAVPAILIILLLSPFATKSRLKVEQVIKSSSRCVYADLNSDSVSEVMLTGKGAPYFFILIMNNDMKVYDQWNLQDSIDLDMSDFFIGNYDHDRYKEIYAFTYKDDSLFLNINEFFDPKGTKLDRLYITKIRVVNNKVTSIIRPAGFFDTNGDGKDELFFSIQTGFGVEPRRLYSYDIVNRELKTSQLTGEICQFPKMVDADGDGRPEIPGLTNHLDIYSYKNEDLRGYVVAHNTGSADTTVMKPRIMFYSLDGKKIRERLFSEFGFNTFTRLVVMKNRDKDRIYLFGKEFLELNDQFVVIKRVKSPFNYQYDNSYIEDMDFDGENELIFYSSNDEKLAVYNADLRKIAEAKLKGTFNPFRFSHYSSRDHVNKLFMNANGGYGYFLTLKGNIYYYLGYLAYPGIYLLFFFFIVLIKRINTLQVVQKESLNRRLVTLQLQGIKSQLDPHFTFNTLNSIASLIYLDDRQLAYDYMNKFTQLLRGLINDADRIYRSLGEELEFVTTYLDLEKLRFGDKFNYEIIISEHVSQRELVPKLVLHTFAENAIKHGIMSLEDGGMLKIGVEKDKDYLILSVEDNGVGRAKAEGQGTSTGKGLRLTREFYDILNQLNKMPIRHTIIDLYNEKGDSVGTRVEVWVPVED